MLRLLEAAGRTIASLDPGGADDFLAKQHEATEAGRLQMIEKHEDYLAWFDRPAANDLRRSEPALDRLSTL